MRKHLYYCTAAPITSEETHHAYTSTHTKGLKTPRNICIRYTPSRYKFNLLSVKYKRNI